MQCRPAGAPPRVAYFFTRFPHRTETFLQREVRAMRRLGLEPRLYSFHGGAGEFEGAPVERLSKWSLLRLFARIPGEWRRHPAEADAFVRRVFTTWPRDWINYWENLYGVGIGGVCAARFRREGVDHIHAAWASLPAMAAWTLSRLTGIPFSLGAHAYDLFEHDGDWFLREKCRDAAFVHTSTDAGRRRLLALGVASERIVLARRGLDALPPCRPLRAVRAPLRILCVARLVEKKGLPAQLAIYRAARDAGLAFRARILGDGPLRPRLEAEIRALHLADCVELAGHVSLAQVWAGLAASDVLLHTGVVTRSGDRDGLPNVVPEAMAAGVIVVTTPGEGVLEAIEAEQTGLVCAPDDTAAWLAALRRVRDDDALAARLRRQARRWVEENFDAAANAALLLERFRAATIPAPESEAPNARKRCSIST